MRLACQPLIKIVIFFHYTLFLLIRSKSAMGLICCHRFLRAAGVSSTPLPQRQTRRGGLFLSPISFACYDYVQLTFLGISDVVKLFFEYQVFRNERMHLKNRQLWGRCSVTPWKQLFLKRTQIIKFCHCCFHTDAFVVSMDRCSITESQEVINSFALTSYF